MEKYGINIKTENGKCARRRIGQSLTLILAAAAILASLAAGCGSGGKPEADGDKGSAHLIQASQIGSAFGVSDEAGGRLITFAGPNVSSAYEKLDIAIGKGGIVHAIEFAGWQEPDGNDSGRATSANFEHMGGYVYNVSDDTLKPDTTYYIADSNALAESLIQAEDTGNLPLDGQELSVLTEAKGRIAQEGWVLGDLGGEGKVIAAVFEPQGSQLLMSIVLNKGDSFKFMDYPAELKDGGAWRVDDGGVFAPEMLSVLFGLRTEDGMVIAVSWAGAEGEVTYFLIETDAGLEELPASAYRYWSPA